MRSTTSCGPQKGGEMIGHATMIGTSMVALCRPNRDSRTTIRHVNVNASVVFRTCRLQRLGHVAVDALSAITPTSPLVKRDVAQHDHNSEQEQARTGFRRYDNARCVPSSVRPHNRPEDEDRQRNPFHERRQSIRARSVGSHLSIDEVAEQRDRAGEGSALSPRRNTALHSCVN